MPDRRPAGAAQNYGAEAVAILAMRAGVTVVLMGLTARGLWIASEWRKRAHDGYMSVNDSEAADHADEGSAEAADSAAPAVEGFQTFTVSTESAWTGLRSKIGRLWVYLWPVGFPSLQLRVFVCFVTLVLGRVVNVYVPIYYKASARPRVPAPRGVRRPADTPTRVAEHRRRPVCGRRERHAD